MAIVVNLSKGQTVNLSKQTNGSKNFQFRASWDVSLSKEKMDLDLWAIELDSSGACLDVVYYNNLISNDTGITLSHDDRTGGGQDWNEVVSVDSNKLNKKIDKIVCIVSIDKAELKGQNFGLVRNLHLDIYDETNSEVIANFCPDLENGTSTAMVLCEIVVKDESLYFKPLLYESKLTDILDSYKIGF